MQTTLTAAYTGSFTTNIALTYSVNPAGPTVTFGTNPLTTATTSTTVTLNGTNALAAGDYIVTVTGTAGAIVQSQNITFSITPGAGPAIGTQPLPQTVCAGNNATFVVAATGTYQWQVSTPAVPAFTNIGGATSATLTINGVTAAQNGNQYRCVVSSQCGSTNSAAAALTVNTAPAITTNPQSVTLCASSNNTFNVAATGAGLIYQWQVSTPAVPAFTDIAAATSSSYTINGITAGMNGNQYRCVVSGTCPSPATSTAATLTVVSSVTVTAQPVDQIVCAGSNTSFTVAGSGPGVIYQWQVNTGTGFVNVTDNATYSGSGTPTLTLTGVTVAMNTYQYRAQLSNATCTTPGISNTAILTVNTLPAISAHPQDVTICAGANNTFSVTATGTALTYQWQISTPAAPAFTNIPAATSATYTVSNVTSGMSGNKYQVIVSGTCTPPVTSNAATLTVINPVSITTQPVATTQVCSGSNVSFSVVATSSQTISYQWQVSTAAVPAFTNVPGATAATLTLNAVAAGLNGNQYRVQLTNATCTAPISSSVSTLTVRQLPTVGLTAAPLLALLPGQTTTLTATPSAQTTGTLTTSWFKDGTAINNTGNTRIVNVENIGTYRVNIQEVFPGLTCSNQSADVVITATASSKLFIFPSPNDGRFTVSYYNNGGTSTTRTITLYDSKGGRVYFKSFPITGPYTLIPIDIYTKSAQKGIYYVVVGDATGKVVADGKVLVQ